MCCKRWTRNACLLWCRCGPDFCATSNTKVLILLMMALRRLSLDCAGYVSVFRSPRSAPISLLQLTRPLPLQPFITSNSPKSTRSRLRTLLCRAVMCCTANGRCARAELGEKDFAERLCASPPPTLACIIACKWMTLLLRVVVPAAPAPSPAVAIAEHAVVLIRRSHDERRSFAHSKDALSCSTYSN